jgi:hypothetical protein
MYGEEKNFQVHIKGKISVLYILPLSFQTVDGRTKHSELNGSNDYFPTQLEIYIFIHLIQKIEFLVTFGQTISLVWISPKNGWRKITSKNV